MKRIPNVNSFSAIIDRLIIENLKIIQFTDKDDLEKAKNQIEVIKELKNELNTIFKELINKKYKSIKEQRTYSSEELYKNLFKLCVNNYCIAKYDKLKLSHINKPTEEIDLKELKKYIENVRYNLEDRAKNKNEMENI